MKISETSIRRPVLASMIILAMVVFGAGLVSRRSASTCIPTSKSRS